MNPDQLIFHALEDGTFPGIVTIVQQNGRLIYSRAEGKASLLDKGRNMSLDSLFDLASLTKPLATTLVLLNLLEQNNFSTERVIGDFLPLRSRHTAALKFHDILLHSSGLPALPEMFRIFENGNFCVRKKAVDHLMNIQPDQSPRHSVIYSCTGFILLGLAAEKIGGMSLDKLFNKIILSGTGLTDLMFTPSARARKHAVCEGYDPWRGRWLEGEVHDENAWTLGGVSGNAGLFGTAQGVLDLCDAFLDKGVLRGKTILSEEMAEKMIRYSTSGIVGDHRAYGLVSNSPDVFAGSGFSDKSFGHTGFTGTSFWIDPEKKLKIIIMTNRVHLGRNSTAEKIKVFRKAFHPLFL